MKAGAPSGGQHLLEEFARSSSRPLFLAPALVARGSSVSLVGMSEAGGAVSLRRTCGSKRLVNVYQHKAYLQFNK